MKFKKKEVVPVGVYEAEFIGCEPTTHADYGDGIQWSWMITSGPYANQLVYRTTKDVATRKNSLGKFLCALAAKGFDDACEADTDDYIGARHSVVIGETEGGSTRVESFIPKADATVEPAF